MEGSTKPAHRFLHGKAGDRLPGMALPFIDAFDEWPLLFPRSGSRGVAISGVVIFGDHCFFRKLFIVKNALPWIFLVLDALRMANTAFITGNISYMFVIYPIYFGLCLPSLISIAAFIAACIRRNVLNKIKYAKE